jgi:hypothetical protein
MALAAAYKFNTYPFLFYLIFCQRGFARLVKEGCFNYPHQGLIPPSDMFAPARGLLFSGSRHGCLVGPEVACHNCDMASHLLIGGARSTVKVLRRHPCAFPEYLFYTFQLPFQISIFYA